MIVLDTNVLSELVRGSTAHPGVLSWVRSLGEQPVTTVLNRAELLAGIALLPPGRRRDDLGAAVVDILSDLVVALPFGDECAAVYAEVVAVRRRAGRPIATMDALIASIALVNGAAVATRDVSGFDGVGLAVVDPWGADPRTT